MGALNDMLHILTGPVVHGQGKGTDAGFPTANLYLPEGTALPPFGVYWTRVAIGDRDTLGVTNVGLRPTADDRDSVTVETFLPDIRGDLYGKTIRLMFQRYLRETVKFPSMDALKDQIARAARVSEGLTPGSVLVLRGKMGAGKSEFSRGIARGLGVIGPVPSPSFTILNAYDEGRLPLYHFDWYRVEDPEELYEIGAPEYLPGDGVTLVEWAERAEELLSDRRTEITIQPLSDTTRLINIAKHVQ